MHEASERGGSGGADGPAHHACYGAGDRLRVFDVWDSKESFERFGKTLMPILQEIGIDAGAPEVVEVHNIVRG